MVLGKPLQRPGSFADVESMKTAQETILEIAKNQQVISTALAEVGPPQHRTAVAEFPTGQEVETLRRAVRISPPKGAELGRTEIIYLAVKDTSREPKLTANQKTLFTMLHTAGSSGLSLEDWNNLAREAGIGVKRKADLNDIRTALLSKRLVRRYGDRWTVDQG